MRTDRLPLDEPIALVGDPGLEPRHHARIARRSVMRVALGFVVVLVVLIGAYFIPLPSIGQARVWSDQMGPWFVVAFFAVYAVATTFPVPRTAFTIPAGVLFGPVVGFAGSMLASSIAAVAALLIVRRFGRARVEPYLSNPVVSAIEERLERRGWLAVGSLRFIAACPFSVCNYASALSSVRLVPYTVASVVGMIPGTAAVVFLGDALAGQSSPGMIAVSASLFAVGVIGLIIDARLPSGPPKTPAVETSPVETSPKA